MIIATYSTPTTCSTRATERACGSTGRMSERPTLVSVAKDRNSRFGKFWKPSPWNDDERAGVEHLHRHERVGEAPRHDGEVGSHREDLVPGDEGVVEQVAHQAVGRVAVEQRVQHRGPQPDHPVAGVQPFEHGEDHHGDAEENRDPGEGRRRPHRPDGHCQHEDPEDAEDRAPGRGVARERVGEDGDQLGREQHPRRVLPDGGDPLRHGANPRGPVVAGRDDGGRLSRAGRKRAGSAPRRPRPRWPSRP